MCSEGFGTALFSFRKPVRDITGSRGPLGVSIILCAVKHPPMTRPLSKAAFPHFPPMRTSLFKLSLLIAVLPAYGESEALPKTVATIRGRELYADALARLPQRTSDQVRSFASGFKGWRFNPGPEGGKGGRWEESDNAFHGIESPGANHPATASYGLGFRDAIIQVDVRLNDVPAEGRKYRSIFVKATDEKDYVCGLFLGQSGLNLVPYSADRINPASKQRDKDPQGSVRVSLNLGEWYTVLLEMKDNEAVGSVGGKTVAVRAPLIAAPKCSIMLGVGTDASFRNLRIWEALPNPDWTPQK